MNERNPFAKKNTELFADVASFLRFFSPLGIKRLFASVSSPLLEGVWIFRSPPGFGKSTTFRLFTPSTLRELQNQRSEKTKIHNETISELNKFDVFGEQYPRVLGIYINVADGFSEIHEIFDEKALPVFRAFINAKVILMTIAALKDFYFLHFEDGLEDFSIEVDNDISWGALPKTTSLQALSDWAENAELQIIKGISTLELADEKYLLHTEYSSLKWLRKARILYKGKQHITKTLVMFDDVHNLAYSQRDDLLESITVIRPHYPIWLGERLTCLTEKETLIEGADKRRDYNILNLDKVETSPVEFKRFIESIIRARMDMSSVGGFDTWLTINAVERNKRCKKAYEALIPQIVDVRLRGGFSERIGSKAFEDCEPTFSLVAEMQSILTSIAKYLNKNKSWPLLEESIENMPKAEPAFVEYFLHTQYNIPYYIGSDVLTKYSTASVYEVLQIAECFFEEIYKASMRQSGGNTQLKISVQEKTIRALAKEKFDKLTGVVRYSAAAQKLLSNFANTAFERSNKDSAPYPPSITGFALSDVEMEKLVSDEKYAQLNTILTDLRKHNFVTIRKNKENNSVFYLNRLLCVHFNLAGGYGGWNKFDLSTLTTWMEHTLNKKDMLSTDERQGELPYG
jgi:hypothetical protein